MPILVICISILFFGIGRLLTTTNAKYLLSGYNTMSEEERQKFDLEGFIKFYKGFHLFLSISFLVIGLLLYFFDSALSLASFIGIYPILAYAFFVWKSNVYSNGSQTKLIKIVIVVLLATAFFVGYMLQQSASVSELNITEKGIKIEGSYGEEFPFSSIDSIVLVDSLPTIKRKSNGFAVDPIYKGYFKTASGERVKLIVNSDHKPLIMFVLNDKSKLYYSAKGDSNAVIYQRIMEAKGK